MTTRGCGSSSRLQIHGRCRLAAGGRSATKQGSITPVAAKVNYDEATKTVTLDPVNKLATSKVYTTKISGVKDGGATSSSTRCGPSRPSADEDAEQGVTRAGERANGGGVSTVATPQQ